MKALPSISESLRNVANFSGRQSRDRFWPYALILFVVETAVMMMAFAPEFIASFQRIQQFAIDNPDKVTVQGGRGQQTVTVHGNYSELWPDFDYLVTVIAVVMGVFTVLYAAAVVRRLHDTGRSGFWGLLPLVFLPLPFYLVPRFFSDSMPDLIWVLPLIVNNLLYVAALIFLIYLLTRDGVDGENRYGPQPVA
ncbi:MAG: DUF805 domain-containing protein [Rhodobiaceae bacterium]|nr:DUF805 domain-containing protein [Rhodobiaceae bacterium]MCC0057307.1 DUF805 domain-containing protein [Rhodobiaceae bacterium]